MNVTEPIFTMRLLKTALRRCRTLAEVKVIWLRCKPEPAGMEIHSQYDPARWARKIHRRERELSARI